MDTVNFHESEFETFNHNQTPRPHHVPETPTRRSEIGASNNNETPVVKRVEETTTAGRTSPKAEQLTTSEPNGTESTNSVVSKSKWKTYVIFTGLFSIVTIVAYMCIYFYQEYSVNGSNARTDLKNFIEQAKRTAKSFPNGHITAAPSMDHTTNNKKKQEREQKIVPERRSRSRHRSRTRANRMTEKTAS